MKLVLISDTHQRHMRIVLPKGDVLVHAGDFCSHGDYAEVASFGSWLRTLDYNHILFIAGNHDRAFETDRKRALALIPEKTITGGKIHYLQDSEVIIRGVKFYGSPWQPRFYDWAFNLPRDGRELKRNWDRVPDDTDVLITHCPPHGILDKAIFRNENIGCKHLFRRVIDIKPKLHVFGHCHAGYGMNHHLLDGTDFVNACIVDDYHYIKNGPVEYEDDFNGKDTGASRARTSKRSHKQGVGPGDGSEGNGFIGEGI